MFFGNIIAAKDTIKVNDYFHYCQTMEEVDVSLPTLIIGLNLAKKYIENFNIRQKQYNSNHLWWTFKNTERKTDHTIDIHEFVKYCIKNIFNSIHYKFVNILGFEYSNVKDLLLFLDNNEDKYYYVDRGQMVFVCLPKTKWVYGFSLSTIEYIHIKKEKVLKRISRNPNNHLVDNFDTIAPNFRNLIGFQIPYLLVFSLF